MRTKILLVIALLLFCFSTALAQSVTQPITLKTGFNFVSFTVAVSLTPAQFKTQYTQIDDIYLFSAAAGSFLSANDGSLTSLAAGKGYIFKSKSDAVISVSGSALSTLGNITLKTGFNLIGFSKVPQLSATFSQIMTTYGQIHGIYKWSPAASGFIQVVRNVTSGLVTQLDGADPTFKAGDSYFINVDRDTTINYEGSTMLIGNGSTVPYTPPAQTEINGVPVASLSDLPAAEAKTGVGNIYGEIAMPASAPSLFIDRSIIIKSLSNIKVWVKDHPEITTQTDANGAFTLKDVPVAVKGSGNTLEYEKTEGNDKFKGVITDVPVVEKKKVDLKSYIGPQVIKPSATIQGKVALSDSLSPLGADVYIAGISGVNAKADEDGTFSLMYVPVGTFTVTFQNYGYEFSKQIVTVQAGEFKQLSTVVLRKVAPVNTACTVDGYVTGSDNIPVINTNVSLISSDAKVDIATVTSTTGHYQFKDVTAGTYKLIFAKDGHKGAEQQVILTAGQVKHTNQVLIKVVPVTGGSGYGMIAGYVKNQAGSPIRGAIIMTIPPTEQFFTDNNGFFSFLINPGEYTLVIKKAGFSEERLTTKINEDQVTEFEANLVNLDTTIVSSVAMNLNALEINQGESFQLIATLKDSSGYILYGKPIEWQNSNTAAGTISPTGLFTANSAGSCVVTAKSGDKSAAVNINITSSGYSLTQLQLFPASVILKISEIKHFTLVATFSDGQIKVISPSLAGWAAGAPLNISEKGSCTAVAAGTTSMTATFGGKTAAAGVTVSGEAVDDKPPVINHQQPVIEAGKQLVISANVTDNIAVGKVSIFFKKPEDASYQNIDMVKTGEVTYTYTIPAALVTASGIQYYLRAEDTKISAPNVSNFPANGALYPIVIKPLNLSEIVLSLTADSLAAGAVYDLSLLNVLAKYTPVETAKLITPVWIIKSGGGTISNNSFTAPPAAATVVLTASYTENTITKTADMLLTITGSQKTQTPVFTPNGGNFSASRSVTVTCPTAGAAIKYTTDGTTPGPANGMIYSSAITISATTTIKAIAIKDGMTDSDIASATFNKVETGTILITLYHPPITIATESVSLLSMSAAQTLITVTDASSEVRFMGESPERYYNYRVDNVPAGQRTIKIAFPGHTAGGSNTAAVIKDGEITMQFTLAETGSVPDFDYTDNGTSITVTKYKGSANTAAVPDFINGKPVTGIGPDTFRECYSLTNITIPAGVTTIAIDPFLSGSNLTAITVDAANLNFTSDAGVLYDKNKTTLRRYPIGKSGAFTIPSSVTKLEQYAFFGCKGLTDVAIPASVTSMGSQVFSYSSNLASITVDAANSNFTSDAGLLYNKNKTAIIQFALARSGNFTIPSGVTTISDFAFGGCGLTNVTIPANVTNIGNEAFQYSVNMTSAYFLGNAPAVFGVSVFDLCAAGFKIYYTSGSAGWTNPWKTYTTAVSPNSDFEYTDNGTSITITKYKGAGGSAVIPDTITGKPVTGIGIYTFQSCSSLTSVTIPSSVTSIGVCAFNGCDNLTSVNIPNGVTSIGNSAFFYCKNLTSVSIPASLASMGYTVFASCDKLNSITVDAANSNFCNDAYALYNKNKTTLIQYFTGKSGAFTVPDGVTTISSQAFYSCGGLTGVTIPASVTYIGSEAFTRCINLTSMTVNAANLNYVMENGVLYNKNKTTLLYCPENKSGAFVIPDGVTIIGNSAFLNCINLTGITIPDSVTNIGNGAFFHCTSLTSVTIPANVNYIVSYAFQNCTSLTSAYFLGNIPATFETGVFDNCAAGFKIYYTSGKTGWTNPWNGYTTAAVLNPVTAPVITPASGTVFTTTQQAAITCATDGATIKYTTDGSTPSSVNGTTYSGTITVSATTTIKAVAFKSGMTDSPVTSSQIIIEKYLSITDNGSSITISGHNGLNPPGSGNHTSGAAGACLDSIIIPSVINGKPVTGIGSKAFYGCTNLKSVSMPDSVTTIGNEAFSNCNNMTAAALPANLTSIGNWAFYLCYKLTGVSIPAKVTTIGDYAFLYCEEITNITIPAGVTSIGNSSFGYCGKLAAIDVSASNANYSSSNGVLYNKNQTTLMQYPQGKTDSSFTIPASVTVVETNALLSCGKLTAIDVSTSNTNYSGLNGVLYNKNQTALVQYPKGRPGSSFFVPAGVTSIGTYAFYYCDGLTSITLPASLTSIGSSAFKFCNGLTDMVFPANVTNIGEFSFYSCSNLTSVTIPAGVNNIEMYAFSFCSGLASAYFQGNTPSSFGSSVFYNAAAGFKIYCLAGKTGWTNPWNGYTTATYTSASGPNLISASFNDVTGNGISSGDKITLTFDKQIIISTVSAADFLLPVMGDSLGAGAAFTAGSLNTQLDITLGIGCNINSTGIFSPSGVSSGSPSGINLSSPTSHITDMTGNAASPAVSAVDIVSISTGKNWTLAGNAAFSARHSNSSVIFNNKMWVIGGYDSSYTEKNDVWYSTDGATWTQATANAAFSARMDHCSVVFDNKMWVIGGSNKNDVWYSSDGITWIQATASAAFPARSDHSCVVFNNKMWVIGGGLGTYDYKSDVWYSSDGVTWTQATSSAGFGGRKFHNSVTYDNKIWVIGGYDSNYNYYNDVWCSTDGAAWTRVAANAAFGSRRNFGCTVFDNKMWVVGGNGSGGSYDDKNDVWYSSDGVNWTASTTSASFSVRSHLGCLAYNNKIWVINGAYTDFTNSVWYSF